MENALLFTGLLLGAALTGGYFGACCAKGRQSEDVKQKLQALQDRVEFLETKAQDHEERLCLCERYDGESAQRIHDLEERVAESELLIGETPDDGLLNRVAKLEEAKMKELAKMVDLAACVDAQGEKLDEIRKDVETMRTVYDEQFRVLPKALAVGPVEQRVDTLEKTQRVLLAADKSNVAYLNRLDERVAGVESMLVSTVGKETEDFCRKMDAVMDKMEGQDG